jgi:hypothetical protein
VVVISLKMLNIGHESPRNLKAIGGISVLKNATISTNQEGVTTPISRYMTYKFSSRKPEDITSEN